MTNRQNSDYVSAYLFFCGKIAANLPLGIPLMTTTTKKVKKRFVAGAKCPKCKAQESIVLFKDNGIETVECVECDYREQQTDEKVAKKATGAVIGVFNPE